MKQEFRDWKSSEVDALVIVQNGELNGYEGMQGNFALLKERGLLEGKEGEVAVATVACCSKILEVAFVGGEEYSEKLVNGLAKAFRELKKRKVKSIGFDFSAVKDGQKKLSRSLGELFQMADYCFDDYKSDAKKSTVETLLFKGLEVHEGAYRFGEVMGESNVLSRKLTNMPSNIMTPEKLAELAKEECEKVGIEVEVKQLAEIEALGMEAFLAVARASDNEPKLIVMRWKGAPDSDRTLGLVGKGLTYDSGGLSIKPTDGMITMKCDMGGASAVISAMVGIAKLGIQANVTAVVATCENMISGRSYKPGDILSSMGGKSIFIGNTDAEGRLTLVDAVTYIIEKEKVTHVLDIATLTGAAVRALGSTVAAVVSNNDDFYEMVEKSFGKAHEKMWRMPLFDEYRELVKHTEADLTNSAGGPGMMTAALFIEPFVQELPWVHVDIAGPAYSSKETPLCDKGGTGSGARPLILLAKKFAKH
ncbi:MAG: leucyl aminopeptidase [Bacillota bacterium]|nr:leucyl aminopeptidase [Bacillota bacterium]